LHHTLKKDCDLVNFRRRSANLTHFLSFARHRSFDACICIGIGFISAGFVYVCLTLSVLFVGCTRIKESKILKINADDDASTGAKTRKHKFSKEFDVVLTVHRR
jgi:hypothetical protein